MLFALVLVAATGLLAWRWVDIAGKPRDVSFDNALLDRAPVTLDDRIHLLGRLAPSVAYAIETTAGLVLVDSGLDPDASSLINELNSLGLDATQIRAILLTHVHGDHTLGARYLRAMTGAKIYAGRGDSAPLRDGGPREAFFSTFQMEGHRVHGTPVDVELKGDEVLVFGDTRITAIATPGHTPGSICYLLERDKQRALFGGDTISSLIGELGTYSAYLAPRYRGNARDYLQSLRKLRAIPTPDLVLPGHPNEQGQPHSPRLSAFAWRQLLDRGIGDMETLVARYDADGEDFLDEHPKQLLAGLYYLGDYRSRSVLVLQAGGQRFLFDAPGDNGLAAHVAQRLEAAGIESPTITAVLLTSANRETTAGLESVVAAWDCPVVAQSTAHENVRAACSTPLKLMPPESLSEYDDFDVQSISVEGCGLGAVAYFIRHQQRDVLISGAAPSSLGDTSAAHLQWILNGPGGGLDQYVRSISVFRSLHPDLWIPAYPPERPERQSL